jgi:hypothetical protein
LFGVSFVVYSITKKTILATHFSYAIHTLLRTVDAVLLEKHQLSIGGGTPVDRFDNLPPGKSARFKERK